MKRFEKITKLIPLLESEETHGEWIIDREHKGTPTTLFLWRFCTKIPVAPHRCPLL